VYTLLGTWDINGHTVVIHSRRPSPASFQPVRTPCSRWRQNHQPNRATLIFPTVLCLATMGTRHLSWEAIRFRLHVEAANSRGLLLLAHLALLVLLSLHLLVLLSLHLHLTVARGRLCRRLNRVPSQWCRYALFVVSNAPSRSGTSKRVDIPSSWPWPSPVLGAQPGLLRGGG
jgi:hypothetical protein